MNRIKKGDKVEVISGNYRGVRGEVLRVLSKENRVVVSDVAIVTKHHRPVRAGRSQMQAGRIKFEAPIYASKVMPICPHCDAPVRVGFTVLDDGHKVRVCRQCGGAID